MASFTWKNPVSGNWNDPAAWDAGVPTGADIAVLSGGTFTVSSNQANAITDLTIAAGVQLAIADNTQFTLKGGTVANAGTISVNSNGNYTSLLIGGGTVTLTGAGTIAFDDRTVNLLAPADAVDTLINVSNTITGSGQFGNGGSLNVDNKAAGKIISSGNAGLTLNFAAGSQFLNEGLIEDTGAGLLIAGNTIDQTGGGTIAAAGDATTTSLSGIRVLGGTLLASGVGASIQLGGASVTAPVVTAANGGVIVVASESTLDASAGTITLSGLTRINNNTTLVITGPIANTGTIELDSNGSYTALRVSGTATLTGGGTVALDDRTTNLVEATASGDTLVNVDNTISGSGQLGFGTGLNLDNRAAGTIVSSGVAGMTIGLGGGQLTNSGLIEAVNSGGLAINGAVIDQSGGGTIAAIGTSIAVSLSGDTLKGGTLLASGPGSVVYLASGSTITTPVITATLGGLIEVPGGNSARLDATGAAITLNGTFQVSDNATVTLAGAIKNDGTITETSNGSYTNILIDTSVTLSGGGTISLDDRTTNRILAAAAGSALVNVDNTISGSGQLGAGTGLVLDNKTGGSILSTGAAGLTIDLGTGQTLTNDGLIEDTGAGGLGLANTTIDQSGGGTIAAVGTGASVGLSADLLKGGTLLASGAGATIVLTNASTLAAPTLTAANGGLIQVAGGHAAFIGASGTATALSGTFVINNNAVLVLRGDLGNAGTVAETSNGANTDLVIDAAAVSMTGGGTIDMDDRSTNRIRAGTSGDKLINVDNIITGSGQIGVGDGLLLDNQKNAKILSTGNAGMTFAVAALSNEGLIEDTGAGGLSISGTTIDQTADGTIAAQGSGAVVTLSGDTLNGGTLLASGAGAVINLLGGSTITTPAIVTSGGGVIQVIGGYAAHLDATGAPITLPGSLLVNDNSTLYLRGEFNNAGSITETSNGNNTNIVIDSATVTLKGGGTIGMSDRAQNRIYAGTVGNKLVNVDNTIMGSGQVGIGNGLAIDNQKGGTIVSTGVSGMSLNTGGGGTLSNEGLIEDTGPGGLAISSTQLTQSDTGTIAALGTGAAVTLYGDSVNGGTLLASGVGALINLEGGSTITTPVISGVNGGGIQVVPGNVAYLDATGATIALPGTLLINNNAVLVLRGDFNNAGTIAETSNGNYTDLAIDTAPVTLGGGGTIAMSDRGENRIFTNTNGQKLVNVDNTIAGSGQIGSGTGLAVDNQASGKILSTGSAGMTISLGNGQTLNNEGLIEDTGAGGIGINGTPVDQSGGGTIAAIGTNAVVAVNGGNVKGGALLASGAGAHIDLNGITVTSTVISALNGAVIDTSNSFTLDASGAPVTLTGPLAMGNNHQLYALGVLANKGTISESSNGNYSDIVVAGTALTLTGGGTIAMGDRNENRLYATANGDKLINVDNTIEGSGNIGASTGLQLDNQAAGTILATGTAAGLTINLGNGQTLTNEGLIESAGTGGLLIRSTSVDQTGGGTVSVLGANALLTLDSASLLGGTVVVSGTGATLSLINSTVNTPTVATTGASSGISLSSGTIIARVVSTETILTSGASRLDGSAAGLLLSGQVRESDNSALTLLGAITNQGTISETSTGSYTDIVIAGSAVTLSGGGSILLGDRAENRLYTNANGTGLVNVDNTIAGSGQLGASTGLVLENRAAGTILSTGNAGMTIGLGNGQTLKNAGLVEDTGAGGLAINGTPVDQTGGGTIAAIGTNAVVAVNGGNVAGGTLLVSGAGARIDLNGITVRSAVISALDGAVIDTNSTLTLDASGAPITLTGPLIMGNGHPLYVLGALVNKGTISETSTGSYSDIVITGSTLTLTGGGTIVMGDRSENRFYGAANGDTLINVDNTIEGSGRLGEGTGLRVDNQAAGTILAIGNTGMTIRPGNGQNITNEGLIGGANSVLVLSEATYSGTGTVAAFDGGSVIFTNSATNQNSDGAGTLTGGAWRAIDGGKGASLSITGGAVTSDAADITLSGTGAAIAFGDGNSYTKIENSLTAIAAAGALHVLGGRGYSTANDVSTSGLLDLGGGRFTANSLTNLTGGVISGFGTVGIGVGNAGTIEASSGLLDVTGAVTGAGILRVDQGATLELGDATAETVIFGGAKSVLKLDQPSSYTGTLSALVPSDTIDLGGVTATAAILTGAILTVSLQGGGTLDYAVADDLSGDRFAPFDDGAGGTDIVVYRKAQPSAHTPEPVAIGNVHFGDVARLPLTLSNLAAADGYSENLDASFGAPAAGLTASGIFTGLTAGATDTTSLLAGVDTEDDGIKSGTVTLLLATDGAGVDGLGPLALKSQTVDVSGTVFAYAAPGFSLNTLDFGVTRTGLSALTQTTKITDGTTADAFQESLAFGFGTPPGEFSVDSHGAGTIVSGDTVISGLSLHTDTAGDFTGSTVTVALTSKAGGAGLSDTVLTPETLILNGKVYAPAIAQLGTSSINFGNHHVGDTVSAIGVTVTNTATGALIDTLTGGFGAMGAPFSGTGSLTALTSGAAGTLSLAFDTGVDGGFSANAPLSLFSHDADQADAALSVGPIALNGTVFALAAPAVATTTLNFGATRVGQAAVVQSATIANGTAVDPFQETLGFAAGTLAGAFSMTGATSGAIAAGGQGTLGLALGTGIAGNFNGSTVSVGLTSMAGGSGLSDTVVSPRTLTLNGKVYAPAEVTLGTGSINFGIVHVGDVVPEMTLAVTNTAGGALVDALTGQFGAVGGPFNTSGSLSLAAGATGTLSVALNTGSAGVFGVTAPLSLFSHDADQADAAVNAGQVSLAGTIDNFATAAMGELTGPGTLLGGGTSYTLDFGTLTLNSGIAIATLGVINAATGQADTLSGQFANSAGVFGLTGFGPFAGLAAGQADMAPSISIDTSVEGVFTETVTLTPTGGNGSGFSVALAEETLTVTATVACFAAGTLIETVSGGMAVEDLAVGDQVVTVGGEADEIVWIGQRRVDCARHPEPATVWPVLVAAGAFGPDLPARDLWLSPDHAVFVNGMLVPVKLLINGTSITQMERSTVTYYHVELPRHAVIFAEGLTVESYLDIGDRANFQLGGKAIRLFPDFATGRASDTAMAWETRAAAPLVTTGPALKAARQTVASRGNAGLHGGRRRRALSAGLVRPVGLEPTTKRL